jgi:hypothetical protein
MADENLGILLAIPPSVQSKSAFHEVCVLALVEKTYSFLVGYDV